MKKIIFAILLVIVIIMTMTICAANSNTQETSFESKIAQTTSISNSQPVASTNSAAKVKSLVSTEVEKMNVEEISDFLAQMVHISETEKLSGEDMNIMGYNFCHIWFLNKTEYDKYELSKQAYIVFLNIYDKAIDMQIPLEEIPSWTNLPVANVLCKYFGSDNFVIPTCGCSALANLSEEDVIRVSETFFNNPLMDINSCIPGTLILLDSSNHTTSIAWEHLISLSKSNSQMLSDYNDYLTYWICNDVLILQQDADNMEKLSEICQNIINNQNYDIFWKYFYFCTDFYYEHYGEIIPNMAIDSLFDLAQNTDDEETVKQLKELASFLDSKIAEDLLEILQ